MIWFGKSFIKFCKSFINLIKLVSTLTFSSVRVRGRLRAINLRNPLMIVICTWVTVLQDGSIETHEWWFDSFWVNLFWVEDEHETYCWWMITQYNLVISVESKRAYEDLINALQFLMAGFSFWRPVVMLQTLQWHCSATCWLYHCAAWCISCIILRFHLFSALVC